MICVCLRAEEIQAVKDAAYGLNNGSVPDATALENQGRCKASVSGADTMTHPKELCAAEEKPCELAVPVAPDSRPPTYRRWNPAIAAKMELLILWI